MYVFMYAVKLKEDTQAALFHITLEQVKVDPLIATCRGAAFVFENATATHTDLILILWPLKKKRSLTAAWSPAVTEKLFTLAIKIATWCHTCHQTIKTVGINSHRRGAIINTVRTDRRTHHVPLKHGKTRCPPLSGCVLLWQRVSETHPEDDSGGSRCPVCICSSSPRLLASLRLLLTT